MAIGASEFGLHASMHEAHLLNRIKEVLLSDCFPSGADGVHASLCAHAADVRSCAVGT